MTDPNADAGGPDERAAGRSGRRPGRPGTREAILDAARIRFAEVGFDNASVRSIAAQAGVDPALVHHYFGAKQQLLTAALDLPLDPALIRDRIAAAPSDRIGETIVRTVLGIWDSPVGVHAVAAFRSILGGTNDPALARAFLLEVVLRDVRDRVDDPPGSGTARVLLAASQMIGLLVARKVVGVEPLASLTPDQLAVLVGPAVQRYLTGDLDLPDAALSPEPKTPRALRE
ncbi:AcrR family transcriptional regulator [Nocardia transvalensis]|uniref:AcrR family transcriptional regulator n=1 Tax=Nocardia transvalensis TaxID=37333 RepID=A0A7W9PK82_9NOCA|nr:TetR family transcriptional regulator [Nocardia transvalensis]MBB5917692.1 AcrR family transcriptional regulator [Nocardia transvalensis]